MRCVAKPVLCLLAMTLMAGCLSRALAQEADGADDLRLETDGDIGSLDQEPPPAVEPNLIPDPEPVVRKRAPDVDAFAAQGMPAGAFRLFPSLELSSEISTNPRRTVESSGLDLGLRLTPRLQFESEWVRHSLSGFAAIEGQTFVGDGDLSSATGNFDTNLRLDVRRTTTADLGVAYTATATEIGDSELPASATGSRLDHDLTGRVAVTHDFGGLEGSLRLGVSHRWFGEVDLVGGGTENNDDRNVTELSLVARGTLKTGAKIQPFGEIAYQPRIFDKKRDRNGLKRSSHGLRLAAGVTIDDDPIWSGELAATLELRDYSDNSLNTVLAPGVAANVTWRPTDLTRFEFNAGASISDTVDAGVSGTKNWTVDYAMVHALRENLDLRAGAGVALDHAGGDTDVTLTSSAGIEWTLNPQMVLGAGYEGTFFRGAGAADDYNDHRLLTRIILRK